MTASADTSPLVGLSSGLFRELTVFGQLASCSVGVAAAWRTFRPHAEIVVDWLNFSDAELPGWAQDEPYVLPFNSPSDAPRAGIAKAGDFGAGLLATMHMFRLEQRFGRRPVPASRHRAWLVKAGLYVFASSGVDSAFDWLIGMNASGLVPYPLHLSQAFGAVLAASQEQFALPRVHHHSAWLTLDVDQVANLEPADGDLALFNTNSGSREPGFGVEHQLRILQTVSTRVESIRAASSLDEWALGVIEAGVLVNAALRLFPAPEHRATLQLVVRFLLDELDELSADYGPGGAGVATSDEPNWNQNWTYARDLVNAAERKSPSHGAEHVIARRLVLPHAVARQVVSRSDLPAQWQLMSPHMAFVWGSHRGWDSRYGSPDDYVRPLPPRPDLTAAAARRVALKSETVPYFAHRIREAAAANQVDRARQALSIQIVDAPFSDELLAAAAYVESTAGHHDAACLLARAALLARPAEVYRWYDYARILARAGAEDAARAVFTFIHVHRGEELDTVPRKP